MSKLYVVLDLETTIRNKGDQAVGKLAAAPYHPDNEIVLCGSGIIASSVELKAGRTKDNRPLDVHGTSYSVSTGEGFLLRTMSTQGWEGGSDIVLVGQNIKFDLLWMLREHYAETMEFFKQGGTIWDTQQAEYLLSGQQEMMIPLSSKHNKEGEVTRVGLAAKYGGTEKDDRIKEYWDNGVDTSDIPLSELEEYCQYDLKNTALVFYGQYKAVLDKSDWAEFEYLLESQMDAIVATTMMEHNGMAFDIDLASTQAMQIAKEYDAIEAELTDQVQMLFNKNNNTMYPITREVININSTRQLNIFLFGGEFKFKAPIGLYTDEGDPVLYKSGIKKGQHKTKIGEITVAVTDYPTKDRLAPEVLSGLPTTVHGYKLDDAAIDTLVKVCPFSVIVFLEQLKKYRKLNKDLNTYYLGLIKLVWPTDSCIHGNINHCTTGTGRLSSSNPNQQNISGKK